jgi:hypothetical protein
MSVGVTTHQKQTTKKTLNNRRIFTKLDLYFLGKITKKISLPVAKITISTIELKRFR